MTTQSKLSEQERRRSEIRGKIDSEMRGKIDRESADLTLHYQALRRTMLSYLRKHVTDPAVAEDLLHEVFLKALIADSISIKRGDMPKNVPRNMQAWLYTIARNTVIDFYRAKRPMDELPDDLVADDAGDNLAEQALAECIRPLIELLPAIYRDTLLATTFYAKTMHSLADELNVSISAVKSRASRGRKMLKQKLLACCAMDLSSTGEVLDFHLHTSAAGCGGRSGCG